MLLILAAPQLRPLLTVLHLDAVPVRVAVVTGRVQLPSAISSTDKGQAGLAIDVVIVTSDECRYKNPNGHKCGKLGHIVRRCATVKSKATHLVQGSAHGCESECDDECGTRHSLFSIDCPGLGASA